MMLKESRGYLHPGEIFMNYLPTPPSQIECPPEETQIWYYWSWFHGFDQMLHSAHSILQGWTGMGFQIREDLLDSVPSVSVRSRRNIKHTCFWIDNRFLDFIVASFWTFQADSVSVILDRLNWRLPHPSQQFQSRLFLPPWIKSFHSVLDVEETR